MTQISITPLLLLMASPGANPVIGSIFMYGAIFAIFYFILIRPQQKQRKEHDAMVKSLRKGDEIVTTGGLVGEVLHIKEASAEGTTQASMDDRVTIKSGESRLIVERGRIAKVRRIATPATTPAT